MGKLGKVKRADYIRFLGEIKKRIVSARIAAYRRLNRGLIKLYWDIGREIIAKQEKFGWGKSIVEKLSHDLRQGFPGTQGYSVQNLWYMRQFYLEYKDAPNLQQLVGEIPWGQNIVIMQRVKDPKAKVYYIKATLQLGWSRNVLIHQIDAEAHKHAKVKKMHNFTGSLSPYLAEQADLALKDSYLLDFLDLSEPVRERKINRKLVAHLKDFITELGLGFCFIGSQYRLRLNKKEYYIDLLFFHRHLRSLVAFELKIGEFKPEYAGKMNFYLNLLDDFVKLPQENPSIGVILCKSRDHIEVEYALRGVKKPIGIAEYKLTKKLPKKLTNSLPTPEVLRKGLIGDRNL